MKGGVVAGGPSVIHPSIQLHMNARHTPATAAENQLLATDRKRREKEDMKGGGVVVGGPSMIHPSIQLHMNARHTPASHRSRKSIIGD